MTLFEQILAARGLDGAARDLFLSPSYDMGHDPFLLPDMSAGVDRLVSAREDQERVVIYGDYDIDGLTATTILVDALGSFGFEYVDTFIPNRFVEGYGMTVGAVEKIAKTGANLILTVDCGSLSHEPITRAKELGIDVVVTDHHNVAKEQPPAVAVINPKRWLDEFPDEFENYVLKADSPKRGEIYPFLDLPGVGVAFKLIQALQTRLDGLEPGHEKWLLDLVALGTVCDVVTLQDENRMHAYWGLEVLKKTRRPGLRALMAVAGVEPELVNARSLGFALGPRMNAAGRLETAKYAQDMLLSDNGETALELAQQLDEMNAARRAEQDSILSEALVVAANYENDPVLVVSGKGWNHGIIGIVAAKLLEKFSKPTYVLEEMDDEAKGSARSYGDFSAADAIRASDDIITKGGGHKLAAGVTLPVENIDAFRARVNEYYRSLKLESQIEHLYPKEDAVCLFGDVTEELVGQLASLEPFGNGNPDPVLRTNGVTVLSRRTMGAEAQHVKYTFRDAAGATMDHIAFSKADEYTYEIGEVVDVWYEPTLNEWRGRRSVEGRLWRMSISDC